jgi:hypothetical protein
LTDLSGYAKKPTTTKLYVPRARVRRQVRLPFGNCGEPGLLPSFSLRDGLTREVELGVVATVRL